jgi:outer membrane lipoprotein LolB
VTARWAAPLCLLLLAGCRVAPPRPALPPVRDLAAIAAFDHWQASGRIAVRTAQDGFSAQFDWRQSGADGLLGVRGPFGAGAARIAIGAGRIRIESGAEPPLEVAPPYEALEPLLVTRLGFALPLESLRYWLLGVPAPGAEAVPAAAGFEQSGWKVEASGFTTPALAPGPLPDRLQLTRGATRIRVLVDRWRADGP